jgi:putative transposase
MTNYRRVGLPGATYFFTVNLVERKGNTLLVDRIDELRAAFRYVKERHPFHIDAIVILPEHLHCIWTLPPEDANFPMRWNLIKGQFSRSIEQGERCSKSRIKRRERGLWQRRFWEHVIRGDEDLRKHIDYIHWNPVKHGWVKNVADWSYSSFHSFVARGVYSADWGHDGRFEIQTGE